jgi:hypothetical protein
LTHIDLKHLRFRKAEDRNRNDLTITAALFDRNGNIGPTAWADGRIVGSWVQRGNGDVVFELLEDVGKDTRTALEAEAARLQSWLGDARVTPRFRTPLEHTLST